MDLQKQKLQNWLLNSGQFASQLPDHIQISGLLDSGGQGIVLQGTCDTSPAAIKIYLPGQISTRIEREIIALQALQTRSIVNLLWSGDVDYDGNTLHVVITNYVEGTPLDKRLSHAPLDLDQIGIVVYDVASAINSMWERRIVHRDLKPNNIIIRPNERACVIDLGVARHLEEATLTLAGVTWGTLGYLSPEQMRAIRQLTCKSDVFSLGIIAIEAALGRHPTSRDQMRLMAQRFHEHLPRELEQWEHAGLIKRMLSPRPTQRPLPNDIQDALSRFRNS